MGTDTLQIIIQAKDQASAVIKQISDSFKTLERSASMVTGAFSKVTGFLGSIGSGIGSFVSGSVSAVGSLASGLFDAGKAALTVLAPVESLGVLGVGAIMDLASSIGTAAYQMVKFAIAGAALALPAVVTKSYIEFEQSIANAVAITGQVGAVADDSRARLMDLANTLAGQSMFSAQQAAEAMYEFTSAGYAAKDVTEQTIKPILDLAQATGSNLQETTRTTLATTLQFGLGLQQTQRVADVFAETVNKSFATMDKLAISMQYAGPVAAAMGQSLEQTSAILGGLYNMGFEASIAGTALRTSLERIANPTTEAQKVLTKLGVVTIEMTPALLALRDTFDRAGAAVDANAEQIKGYREELAASQKLVRDHERTLKQHEEAFKREGDAVNRSKTYLSQYKDLLAGIERTKVKGLSEAEDAIFAKEQQINAQKLELSKMQEGSFAYNAAKKQLDLLEKQREELQLQKGLTFDPQIRAIEKAAEEAKIKMGEMNAASDSSSIIAGITLISQQYVDENAHLQKLTETHEKHAKTLEKEKASVDALRHGSQDITDAITDAENASKRLKDTLEAAGTAWENAPKQARPLLDVLDDLREAGATASDAMEIFGLRAGPAMLALMGINADGSTVTDTMRALTKALENAGGVAERTGNEQLRTLNGSLQIMWHRLQDVGFALVNKSSPALMQFMETVASFTSTHGPGFIETVTGWATSLLAFIDTALTSNEGFWPKLRTLVSNGLQNIGNAFRVAWAVITGDTATAHQLLESMWGRFQENVGITTGIISQVIQAIIPQELIEDGKKLFQDLGTVFNTGWKVIVAIFSGNRKEAMAQWATMKGQLGVVWDDIVKLASDAWSSIQDYLLKLIPEDWKQQWFLFKMHMRILWGEIVSFFRDPQGSISNAIHAAFSVVAPEIEKLLATIVPVAIDFGLGIGKGILKGLADELKKVPEVIGESFLDAIDWDALGMPWMNNRKTGKAAIGGSAPRGENAGVPWTSSAFGGIVGGTGNQDFYPHLLRKDEEIVTPEDPRHRWNGGMGGVNVHINGPVNVRSDQDVARIARAIADEIKNARRGMPARA